MRALCPTFAILIMFWVCPLLECQTPSAAGDDGVLGAWELVSYKYGETAAASDLSSTKKSRAVKLITKGHFVWIVYDLKKKTPSSSGGGTYSLVGDSYTERLEFASTRAVALVGIEQFLKLRIEGDHMTESGRLSDGTKIVEVWKRLP